MNLVEIFSSIQGEGPEVGTRTLFVRFGECDLRCRWCDSRETWKPAECARIETTPGSGERRELPNPISLEEVLRATETLDLERHRWVSLTGGEPLLQPAAVASLAEAFRPMGPGIFLETHGLHAEALSQVIDGVDLVSMDWKLTSDVRRASDPKGGDPAPFHAEHERFLEVARSAPRVVVKLVITPHSRDEEIDEALARVSRVHPEACVLLQPVTPMGAVRERPSARRMQELELRASRILADVRVIPQTHPLIGVA